MQAIREHTKEHKTVRYTPTIEYTVRKLVFISPSGYQCIGSVYSNDVKVYTTS